MVISYNDNLARSSCTKEIPEKLDSDDLLEASKEIQESIDEETDDKRTQRKKQSLSEKLKEESEKVSKYEGQEVPGERNSYSKTDPDATFMRMKNEETLPGFNFQIGTENGFVPGVSGHQNANDGNVFIEHMDKRIDSPIGKPERVIADAGYGYRKNYDYLAHKLQYIAPFGVT